MLLVKSDYDFFFFFFRGRGGVLCLETLFFRCKHLKPEYLFELFFGCETFPFKKTKNPKKWSHNGTRPHLSKCWQRITFRSLTMLHTVASRAVLRFLSLYQWRWECKICILDFRANSLSVWACLLHSWAITVRLMVARVGKGSARGPGKNDGEAPTRRRYSTFADRSSSLCAVCLHNSCRWHVSPHKASFSKTCNPCWRRENGTPAWCPNAILGWKFYLLSCRPVRAHIQDRSLPLRLSSCAVCVLIQVLMGRL